MKKTLTAIILAFTITYANADILQKPKKYFSNGGTISQKEHRIVYHLQELSGLEPDGKYGIITSNIFKSNGLDANQDNKLTSKEITYWLNLSNEEKAALKLNNSFFYNCKPKKQKTLSNEEKAAKEIHKNYKPIKNFLRPTMRHINHYHF